MKKLLVAGIALAALVCTWPAQAGGYNYQLVDYPGAPQTGLWGINDHGVAIGVATGFADGTTISFEYRVRTQLITVVPGATSYSQTNTLAINNGGVMAGGAVSLDGTTESGFIRHPDGTFVFFSQPGWDNTEARGINDRGVVAGYSYSADGTRYVGFIYHPGNGHFTSFFPSSFTIAEGINDHGQVVGHVTLDADVAYPGAPAGFYGFRRNVDGSATLFQVNGHSTRARGMNSKGAITGFVNDPATGGFNGFVTQLHTRAGFEAVTIPDASLLVAPGAQQTGPQGINARGVIAGAVSVAGVPTQGLIITRKDE